MQSKLTQLFVLMLPGETKDAGEKFHKEGCNTPRVGIYFKTSG
jgi:hypothetical protein